MYVIYDSTQTAVVGVCQDDLHGQHLLKKYCTQYNLERYVDVFLFKAPVNQLFDLCSLKQPDADDETTNPPPKMIDLSIYAGFNP